MSKALDFQTLVSEYDLVIFDMDGVVTSEQSYWDCAALAVWEFLNSKDYYGKQTIDEEYAYRNYKKIRSDIFGNDRMIYYCKNIGVNSNWDLAYVAFALWLYYGSYEKTEQFFNSDNFTTDTLYHAAAEMISEKTGLALPLCERSAKVWQSIVDCFQEWYLGSEEFEKIYDKAPVLFGKTGLYTQEKPLLPHQDLLRLFQQMKASGISLAVATGRLAYEVNAPLKNWGFYPLFDENRIISYDFVKQAEKLLSGTDILTLAKPHPYMFLKAALGKDYSDEKILCGDYSIKQRVLAVGDAGADILSAKKAGLDFLAVLTGVQGEKGRGYFEENGADYINTKLTDLIENETETK